MFVRHIRGTLGTQRTEELAHTVLYTAVRAALVAGDSSARACQIGAYLV